MTKCAFCIRYIAATEGELKGEIVLLCGLLFLPQKKLYSRSKTKKKESEEKKKSLVCVRVTVCCYVQKETHRQTHTQSQSAHPPRRVVLPCDWGKKNDKQGQRKPK